MQLGWVCKLCFVCVHVCMFACTERDRGLMGEGEGESERARGRGGCCTCSILLSGFSSSGVKKTSSLSKPTPPSWPENTYTHYCSMVPHNSTHNKHIAVLHCRLQHNHTTTKSANFTHHDQHTNRHKQTPWTHSVLRLIYISRCFASSQWLISSLFHSYGSIIQCLQIQLGHHVLPL